MAVQDILDQAFRRLMIRAEDEQLTADQEAFGRTTLESLFSELQTEVTVAWTLDAAPTNVFVPLANLLAVELAPAYEIAPRESRGRAWGRLLAVIRPDDRVEDETPAAEYY